MYLNVTRPNVTRPLLVALLLAALTACSSEETVSTAGSAVLTPIASGITIESLSTRPWLITGGDVLLEIVLEPGLNADPLAVNLNGDDVTAEFVFVSAQRLQALLSGLPLGDSVLTAKIAGTDRAASLLLTNYPISGPIISGPHESPFHCQTAEFKLANGEMLGEAEDANCAVATRVDYVYWSDGSAAFKPLSTTLVDMLPDDAGVITNMHGDVIPYVVRVETGTVNRAIYEIAMLHQPGGDPVDAWNRSDDWNGKLVYTHGGGCRSGWYQQGDRSGGVLRRGLFELGYALTSSSLNVFGQNCNDLLASETHIMVKERFIEHYGVPDYTIATGASGGSYQSHQTADNYPGVFDGIIVSSSFPDVTSATIFTLADARLLNYYFTETNTESFTLEQQRAIAGFGSWGSIPNLSRGAARLDPVYVFGTAAEEQGGEMSIGTLQAEAYRPGAADGIRATVYDHTVNVYGRVDGSSKAQRPLDNRGVQYGLAALNTGEINPQQFIDLNRDIGGFDRDMNHVPGRHRADRQATVQALGSGRILFGGAGLATTPVIDYRSYTDHAENGDIHMIVHQFSTRQRLLNANGHADNHVMQVGGLWGFSADRPDLGDLFREMDRWIIAINSDESDSERSAKVVRNKPASLVDACWDNSGPTRIKLEQEQTFAGDSQCNRLYPAYQTPRHVAGAPLANDIVSCHLRPVNSADYSVAFSRDEFAQLHAVFPQGVCDWSRGDASGARHQGTWVSFGPSPINRL